MISVSIHRIWLCLVSCHFLRALRNLFSSGHPSLFSIFFSHNLSFILTPEFGSFNSELITALHMSSSNFRVYMPKPYIKTLSRVGPLEACRLSHILVQKKASLTNLCIPPSFLLGCALSTQCPQESTNLSQDSTSHCLVCLWSGVSVVRLYSSFIPNCATPDSKYQQMRWCLVGFLLCISCTYDHNLLSKQVWLICFYSYTEVTSLPLALISSSGCPAFNLGPPLLNGNFQK